MNKQALSDGERMGVGGSHRVGGRGEAWGRRKGRLMRGRVQGAGHVKSQADREEAWTSVGLMGRGGRRRGGAE